MRFTSDNFRRWLGVGFLTIAVGMLVPGLTILEPELSGLHYIIFWCFCFLFTLLAVATALLDWLIVRWKARQEQRTLIERTLREVEKKRLDEDENLKEE